MKNWQQTNEQIEALIATNLQLQIVSGEGETGKAEDYYGKRTVKAINMRLTAEKCNDTRWARLDTIDGHALNGII